MLIALCIIIVLLVAPLRNLLFEILGVIAGLGIIGVVLMGVLIICFA